MAKVVMKSWREGLRKVSLTKLQVSLLDKSLVEAKNNVDSLLEGNKVEIATDNISLAQAFCIAANRIGVDCYIESTP